jgi:hypothetical protein
MSRKHLSLAGILVLILGATMAGTFAGSAQVPADATPGAQGVNGVILGGVEPVVAPGYRLVLAELVFEPGTYATEHFHPTAIVFCVQSGQLGFAIHHGSATLTRDGGEPDPIALDTDMTLEPRDCVAFDHFAAHTTHSGWNLSDGPTVLWEARLFKTDEPFTTFVDEQGTPVPAP